MIETCFGMYDTLLIVCYDPAPNLFSILSFPS